MLILGGVAIARKGPSLTGDPQATQDPTAVFFGDSYTGGSSMGGNGDANYTHLLGERGQFLVLNAAVGGSGYVQPGANGSPFSGEIGRIEQVPNPALVVVAGSSNDVRHDPGRVRQAASDFYDQVRRIAPRTRLVVVGPLVPMRGAALSPEFLATRDAVRAAAQAVGAPFIDPIAERWLDSSMIGSDQVHPTDNGHRAMADRLEVELRKLSLFPARSLSGATPGR